MPGLIRMMGRTAAIAGTATAVSNRVSRRQYDRWAEQDAASYSAAGAVAPPPTASGGSDDRMAQLKELAALKDQGVLTDQEFASEKARILAG
ncbi:MAG: SHOCT domain-containing protein [Solirubrobacterales bacterium]|nr:SHOCT domain-containing protein [Solirubrobacterales bacterium]